MASAAERLSALRQKLQDARDDNLKAVADEGLRLQTAKRTRAHSDSSLPSSPLRRRRKSTADSPTKRARTDVDVGSADEADGEDADDRLRSMKRRARRSHKVRETKTKQCASADGDGQPGAVTYGGAGGDEDDVDNMVSELQQVEKRRAKFRRRRAFDEDRSDITFINEGNRIFNRALERHFDKFESVQKLKDSLERGTA